MRASILFLVLPLAGCGAFVHVRAPAIEASASTSAHVAAESRAEVEAGKAEERRGVRADVRVEGSASARAGVGAAGVRADGAASVRAADGTVVLAGGGAAGVDAVVGEPVFLAPGEARASGGGRMAVSVGEGPGATTASIDMSGDRIEARAGGTVAVLDMGGFGGAVAAGGGSASGSATVGGATERRSYGSASAGASASTSTSASGSASAGAGASASTSISVSGSSVSGSTSVSGTGVGASGSSVSGSTSVSGTGVGASGGGYGAAADGRGIGGASGGGDGAAADGRGIGGADASGSAEVSVGVDAILDGAPGVAPEELGGGAGVRATGRGRARLGALTTRDGLNVDGWRLRLGDLGPLAPRAALEADARLATDAHLEASAELAHATLPAGEGETDVVVRVRGGQPAATRARVRVHLVVDRSSSMHSAWPEVLAAAEALLEQLQPQDEIHIVAYGSDAIEVLPPVRVGSGQRAREALAGISIGGGTHLEAGLRVAYGAAARVRDDARPLVILVSDGVPNRGAFGVGELAPLAAAARAELACPTTVIGLGDQFDARLLRGLSAAGRGGYHVAPDARAVGPMLRAEIRAHVRAAARDVRVNVALPDGVELAGELPVEAEAHAGGVRLALPELAAGEERRLTFRVRVRVQARVQPVAGVRVAWRGPAGARVAERALSVERGTRARLRSEAAALAVADAALGQALDLAADHVLNGRRERAVATLRAHVRVQARAPVGGTLRIRTQAVGRFAGALDALVDDASHGERRSLSLAMGALAARLGR